MLKGNSGTLKGKSGDDIVRAIACGADFVFLGRPFLYAVAAAGESGLQQIIDVLAQQTSTVLAQTGLTSIDGITKNILVRSDVWS